MVLHLEQLKWLQAFFCLILVLQTSVSFTVMQSLMPIYYLVHSLLLLNTTIVVVMSIMKQTMSLYDLGVVFLSLLFFSFTIIGSHIVLQSVFVGSGITTLALLFNYYKASLKFLVKTLAVVFSLIVYGNLLHMILFPDWMFAADDIMNSYLLGSNYNQMGCRFLCAILSSMVCIKYGWKWVLNTVLVSIVCIVTLFIVGSKTSLTGIILFLFLCLIPSLPVKKLAFGGLIGFYLLFQFFVCFQGEGIQHNELAVYFVEDVLNKDITFTNRTFMWDSALSVIAQSPLIGYGYVDDAWYFSNMTSLAKGPHNFVFGLLIYGGIAALLTFIMLIVLAFRKSLRHIDHTSVLILLALATLLFMQTMEFYPIFFTIYIVTLFYYYPEIQQTYHETV